MLKKKTKEYYETPGGKVREGESLNDAFLRELKEEINITPTEYTKIKELTLDFEDKHITDHIYLIKEYEGDIALMEDIFEGIFWIDLDALDHTPIAPNIKEIMPLLKTL